MISRRHLLALAAAGSRLAAGTAPVRAITRAPKFHWFGYYDKWQFDPADRYVLGNEVDFEHRSPQAADVIRVGMIDTKDNDRWIEFGTSRAWCWQQGCMLQWLPGSQSEVIWNDSESGQYVSHVLDVKTGKKRTVGAPVYGISPDGKWAVSPDFRRLHKLRPGYGYAGIPDPNTDIKAPKDAGIWRTNLMTGRTELIIPISQIAAMPAPGLDTANAKHWFNHLLFSPDGSRFIFLHRWQGPQHKTFVTRMFTAAANGSDLYVLDPHGRTSHFIWRDNQHVLAWAWHPSGGDKFYLYRDKTTDVQAVGSDAMPVNGHCTYLPKKANRWILNDTYPDRQRKQNVYLFDTKDGQRHELGGFHSPAEYTGEWRCDTHPRASRNGQMVTIDSPHDGGRQIYLLDLSAVLG